MAMTKRSTLGGGTLIALALLFIGLTVLFNYALRGWRLDLTQNHLYTTAPGTDRILKSIKEPINLYFFFSEKAATQIPQLGGEVNAVARIGGQRTSGRRAFGRAHTLARSLGANPTQHAGRRLPGGVATRDQTGRLNRSKRGRVTKDEATRPALPAGRSLVGRSPDDVRRAK